MHCRMAGNILGLYRAGARITTSLLDCDNQKCLPERHNHPWLGGIVLEIHINAMGLTTKDRHKSDGRMVGSRRVPQCCNFSGVSKEAIQVIYMKE